MLPWIASQTVTRLRGVATTDDYQNVNLDFTNPGRLLIEGCAVQPVTGAEFNEGRDAITTRWNWYGPDDADVSSVDRIEFNGVSYDIDGSVMDWDDPTGSGMDHRQAILRRIDG